MSRVNYGQIEREKWARAQGHTNLPTPGVVLDIPYSAPRHCWIRAWNEILCSHCRRPMGSRAYVCCS
jgi:hypothetical protein